MADGRIEGTVRVHLTLLRAAGPAVAAQVSNDWLRDEVAAGHEVGIAGDETSIARIVRKFDLREAGLDGTSPSLRNLEKLLLFSKSKDGITRSLATHIDTAMKNEAGANNVVLNGDVISGLFQLTGKPWIADEYYREYAEVFREYLEICIRGRIISRIKRYYWMTWALPMRNI